MNVPTPSPDWAPVDQAAEALVGSARFAELAEAAARDRVGTSGDVPAEAAELPAGITVIVGRGTAPPAYRRSFGGWTGEESVAVASAAKWPVAFAALSLVADGALSLNDTIDRWFPSLADQSAGRITIEHLLSHRSGLTPFHPALGERDITLAEATERILADGLIFEPGTAFAYGGSSMQVFGRIAELVTGQAWHELFHERVAGPLGAELRYGDTRNPRVPGGLIASADAYDRVLRAHLGGGTLDGVRVVPADLVADMQRDRTGEEPVNDPYGGTRPGYGLGVWIEATAADGAPVRVASGGAWGTIPWVDLRHGYRALIVLYGLGVMGALVAAELAAQLRPLIEERLT